MKLLPIHPSLAALAALLPRGPYAAVAEETLPDAHRPALDAREPDWRSAYLRRRAQDEEMAILPEPPPELPLAPPALRHAAPEAPLEVRAIATATPTAEKLDALRQLAEAHPAAVPVARTWQVELPATAAGPAWQLHIEQAQPLAPLNLELRVPPVAQSQARQQLSDLDKRLRDAGHDVLRPRVSDARASKRFPPLDEVQP